MMLMNGEFQYFYINFEFIRLFMFLHLFDSKHLQGSILQIIIYRFIFEKLEFILHYLNYLLISYLNNIK